MTAITPPIPAGVDLSPLFPNTALSAMTCTNPYCIPCWMGPRRMQLCLAPRETSLSVIAGRHGYFRYWHVFHLPPSTVMFPILLVQIAVAVLFPHTWVF